MRKSIMLGALLCLLLCVMTCGVQAASTADANEPINPSAPCSLTLHYALGEVDIPSLPVYIYHVATVSSDFQYTLTDAFASTGLTINGVSSSSEWAAIRTTLESVISADRISPDASSVIDPSGNALFKGLIPGLYLVSGVQFSEEGAICEFASTLVALPNLDANGHWVYDLVASPKPSIQEPTGEDKDYKVIKLWRDNGALEHRSDSVTIEILRNGEVIEQVILSDQNGWSYTWRAVDNGDVWQVVERDVPDGYRMTVEEHADCFTVINTIPGIPESPATSDSSNVGFFVMLLFGSGFLLVMLGVAAKRKPKA